MLNGLWRNADFVRCGPRSRSRISAAPDHLLALPLTAKRAAHATPLRWRAHRARVGALALFGLFAGVLVDRAPKLPIIIWSDVGRALALLVVPLCAWLGVLSMGVLYVVGSSSARARSWVPAYQCS